MAVYFSIFFSGFLAATLLPALSEFALGALVGAKHSPLGLWAAATVGNTLGGCANWLLGRYLRKFENHRYFPVSKTRLKQADKIFNRYGKWTLLLSWLPVIGDPLTLIAGTTKLKFSLFLALVAIGKGLRYAVVIGVALTLI